MVKGIERYKEKEYKMKIAVVGTGAMGSLYAALLGDAGNEVWAIDQWKEHVDAIQDKGLRLEGISGDRTVHIQAATSTDSVGPCDLVIIATKAMHVAAAAESSKPLMGPETIVVSIQNGLGGPQIAEDILGKGRVLIGVAAGFGASIKNPGHAHHNGMGLMRLGEMKGPAIERTERTAKVWSDAGFNVKTFDDINQLIWEKLICNVCFSGTCAITEWTLSEVMADEDAWRIASGCAKEAFDVAKAKGISVDIDDPVQYVYEFGSKMPNAKPSMLLDYLEGRQSEVDYINGAIPAEGEKVGVPAPFNTLVTSVVRIKEKKLGVR